MEAIGLVRPALRAVYHLSLSYPILLLLEFFVLVALLWWCIDRGRKPAVALAQVTSIAAACCGGLAVLLLAVEWVLFFARGAFLSHAEPQIACVAALAVRGEPIYHSPDAALAYSVVYGPLLYLLHAAALFLCGASIRTTQAVGVLAFLASVAFFVAWAHQVTRSRPWPWMAGLIVTSLLFWQIAFWSRADPWLLLLACVGLWSSRFCTAASRAWVLGVSCGLAVNLKIYGALVLLPALSLGMPSQPSWHWLRLAVGFSIGLALPFLAPAVSLQAYLATMAVATGHKLQADQFVVALSWIGLLLAPLGIIRLLRTQVKPAVANPLAGEAGLGTKPFHVALVAGMLMTGVFSCKAGGGDWYFLPFVPYILGAVGVALYRDTPSVARSTGPQTKLGCLMALAWLGAISFITLVRQFPLVTELARSEAPQRQRELGEIMRKWQGYRLQMSGGTTDDGRGYETTYCRPLLVFAGHPYWFDFNAVMDLHFTGQPIPPALLERILEDRQTLWISPVSAEPFRLTSFYNGQEIFPSEFRAAFQSRFEVWEQGKTFAVWGPRARRVAD